VAARSVPGSLWWPVVIYMATIFVVQSMPQPPAPPGLDDKTQHFLAYGGLGLVTLRATSGGAVAGLGVGSALTAWAITTLYGASDEYHQSFVPGRSPDVFDLIADAIGAASAIGAGWLSGILLRSRRARGDPPRSR
jgi:VanZ family protein